MTSRTIGERSSRKGGAILVAVFGFLVAVSAIFIYGNLDRTISSLFYSPGRGWFLANSEPWRFLYRYGTIPGLVLTLLALAGLIAGSVRSRMLAWRRYLLLVLLTSILGSGLIVNSVLKPYWGRPRPRQIQEFGGLWTYRDFHRPGIPGKGQSFPSGHCSMGFLFVSLYFLYRKSPRVALAAGSFGVFYGTLIGVGRIAQGAHFASDVLWSFGVMLLVPLILYYFVLKIPDQDGRDRQEMPAPHRRLMILGLAVAAVVILLIFFTRRPFYETYHQALAMEDGIQHLKVHLDVPVEQSRIEYARGVPGEILIHVRGFGWATASYAIRPERRRIGNTLIVTFHAEPNGYFSELTHRIDVILPESRRGALDAAVSAPDR